jgi:hypothetical protein
MQPAYMSSSWNGLRDKNCTTELATAYSIRFHISKRSICWDIFLHRLACWSIHMCVTRLDHTKISSNTN